MVSGLTRDCFLVSEEGKYHCGVGNMHQERLQLDYFDAQANLHEDLDSLIHVCVTTYRMYAQESGLGKVLLSSRSIIAQKRRDFPLAKHRLLTVCRHLTS
jgi:hypothetical protein